MIVEQQIGEILGTILSSKVSLSIRKTLFNTISRNTSITRSAQGSSIVFPVIATDDITKDVAMELTKSAEVKIAYDIKRILERDIAAGPDKVNYQSVVEMLPFDKSGAVDLATLSELEESDLDLSIKLEREAVEYVSSKIKNVNIEVYSEANSYVIKERGSQPTNIEIEVKYVTGGNKKEIKSIRYNMAIQAIPRYVPSSTLRMKLSTYDNKRFFKRFISLTNPEKHFVKDFLVDYDVMKEMARERTKRNSVFKEIEQARLKKDMGLQKYPFTVFLVTKDFVEKLNDSEKMDMYSESHMIMKKLMAMGIYVYDTDTDLIEIKYDGDKMFTKYPFDEVAKDTSRYERELKQLVRLNK
ncbi:MAG: hypothetical protein ACOCRK_01975 [bacterium]